MLVRPLASVVTPHWPLKVNGLLNEELDACTIWPNGKYAYEFRYVPADPEMPAVEPLSSKS